MNKNEIEKIKVFYSYSHQDEDLRNILEKHLSILRRQGYIEEWHDRKIIPSNDWDKQIKSNLESADLILLLISSDFLSSDYCYDVEIKKAIRQHELGQSFVVPILLRDCDCSDTPFEKLQGLPTDMKPIVSRNWYNIDEAFTDVVKGLKNTIVEIQENKKNYHNLLSKLEESNLRQNPISDREKIVDDCFNKVVTEINSENFHCILIYGDFDYEKTLVLNELGIKFLLLNSDKKVKYYFSKHFQRDFVDSIRNNLRNDFFKQVINNDILIIDRFDDFAGKEKTQEIFSEIFDDFFMKHKKVIIGINSIESSDIYGIEKKLLNKIQRSQKINIETIYEC